MTEMALLWVAAITGVIGAIGSTALGVQAVLAAWSARRRRRDRELQLRYDGVWGPVMFLELVYAPERITEAVYAEVLAGRRGPRIALWPRRHCPEEAPVAFLKTADNSLLLGLQRGVDAFRGDFTVYPDAVFLEVRIWPEHRRGRRRPLARRRVWITRTY